MDFPREMKSPRGLEMTIKGSAIIGHNADWETKFNKADHQITEKN